jgi:hypothetical protein
MKSAVNAIDEKLEAAVHSMRACQETMEAHLECKELT